MFMSRKKTLLVVAVAGLCVKAVEFMVWNASTFRFYNFVSGLEMPTLLRFSEWGTEGNGLERRTRKSKLRREITGRKGPGGNTGNGENAPVRNNGGMPQDGIDWNIGTKSANTSGNTGKGKGWQMKLYSGNRKGCETVVGRLVRLWGLTFLVQRNPITGWTFFCVDPETIKEVCRKGSITGVSASLRLPE